MFRIKINTDTDPISIDFVGKLAPKYQEGFDLFFSKYQLIRVICKSIQPFGERIPKKKRICRFCQKSFPAVTFNNRAHLIPSLMGNSDLFSDFECDTCNSIFSQYESNLADSLGIARTIMHPRGIVGAPKFKSPDKTLITKKDEATMRLVIQSHDPTKKHFTLDEENKKLTIHTHKHGHVPYKVYQSILKIALSSIYEEDVANYRKTFGMLFHENDLPNNPLLKMYQYFNPGPPFPSPLILLFEKNNEKDAIPYHMLCIYFQNYIFQIAIPFHLKDRWMYDGVQKIGMTNAPPFIDEKFTDRFGFPQLMVRDLNGNEKVKGEVQNVTFSFDDLGKPEKINKVES